MPLLASMEKFGSLCNASMSFSSSIYHTRTGLKKARQ